LTEAKAQNIIIGARNEQKAKEAIQKIHSTVPDSLNTL
jgi:hypothetical protein